jgi:nuclear pore complex protein Nup155
MMREMAHRLSRSETTFSPTLLIPMIETYAIEFQHEVGPRTWIPDLFIEVGFPFETIASTLQNLWYNNVAPFTGTRKHVLAGHMIYVLGRWHQDCLKKNTRIFGSDENAQDVNSLLGQLEREPLGPQERDALSTLRGNITRSWS